MVNRMALIWISLAVTVVFFSYLSTTISNKSGQESSEDLARVIPEDLPGMASSDEAIRILIGRVERNPRSFISYTVLGRMHLRAARETGDVTSYLRAEAEIQRALEIYPGYSEAEAVLASVRYAEHDFAGALALAEMVYERNPDSGLGLDTIGDAHLSLGDYEEAESAYQELLRRGVSPPALARVARLTDLQGDKEASLRIMRRATAEALDSGASQETMAWYLARMGDLYFDSGGVDQAADYYLAAINVFDNYYRGLAGLAKSHAARGRYPEAIELYERAVAIIPQPATLASLGDVYAKIGQAADAQRQYDTVEFIAKLAVINRQIYNRELALFYADHDLKVDEALILALGELEVRKDIYGYDTLAWALYKNNRLDEAEQAMTQAMKLGTQDAMLFFHAGMIYQGLGDLTRARDYLEQALNLNPNFSMLQGDLAKRTLSLLSHSDDSQISLRAISQ